MWILLPRETGAAPAYIKASSIVAVIEPNAKDDLNGSFVYLSATSGRDSGGIFTTLGATEVFNKMADAGVDTTIIE